MAAREAGERVACNICRKPGPVETPAAGRRRSMGFEGGPDGPPPGFVVMYWKTVRSRLGGAADFSYWQCYKAATGPIAQLDRVTDFYSVGCRFESCWDRQYLDPIYKGFFQFRLRSVDRF